MSGHPVNGQTLNFELNLDFGTIGLGFALRPPLAKIVEDWLVIERSKSESEATQFSS